MTQRNTETMRMDEGEHCEAVPCYDKTGEALDKIQISPGGRVRSTNGEFVIDRAAFQRIEARFLDHGVALPIDINHEAARDDILPKDLNGAVGWIEHLAFNDLEGISAKVTWCEQGRALIRAGKFRYFSPTFFVDKANFTKVMGLHGGALVLHPAIPNMKKLAAGQRPLTQENRMSELLLIGNPLGLAGADCTVERINKEIGELKKRAEPAAETAKAVLVANAARKALGLKDDADADMVAASIATEKAGTAGLKAMETELTALKLQINRQEAEQWVNAYSAKGVVGIGKDDAERKADREMILRMACSNRADCERVLQQRVAVLPPPGTTKPPAGGDGSASRVQLIASARQEYAEDRMKVSTETVYVNTVLREKGLKPLSKAETEELIAA